MKLTLTIVGLLTIATAYLLYLAAPSNTWINTDSDGSDYTAAARYLVLSHPTGAPLYNLFNAVVVRLPFGTNDFQRIAISTALFSVGTTFLLFLITRNLIAPLVFLASQLIVSQSTIVDTYALITFIITLTYYFHIRNNHLAKYLTIAAGLAIHHLIGFILIPILIVDYKHSNLKYAWTALLGFLFYLYIFIVNRPPYYMIDGNSLKDYASYWFGYTGMFLGLAILPPDDLIIRIHEFLLAIIPAGFIIGTIPFILELRNKWVNKDRLLPMIVLLYIGYYLTTPPPQTNVYLMPAIALGTILIASYSGKYFKILRAAVIISSLIMMLWITQNYAIGRNLDVNMSATNYYNALDKLPQNAVVWSTQRGWENVTAELYNFDHPSRNIVDISSDSYLPKTKEEKQAALLDAAHNNLLYRTVFTDPATYSVAVEKWSPSDSDLQQLTLAKTKIETASPTTPLEVMLKWHPTPRIAMWVTPKELITGGVEISRWQETVLSTHTAAFFAALMTIGYYGFIIAGKQKTRLLKFAFILGTWAVAYGVGTFMVIIAAQGHF